MLQGKTLLITGANGGLGRVVTQTALLQGAQVVLLDLLFASEELEAGVLAKHAVDLTDAAATKACIDGIAQFDGVINLAGGFAMGPTVVDTSDEEWQAMFTINVTTLRSMIAATIPRLQTSGSGCMVNVGAYGALSGQANMNAYCAAKGTVMKLTESLSEEVKADGINVNAVLPTIIDTPANRNDMPDATFSDWVSPAALAEVICFLASDAASAVHGALLPVRGLS